MAKFWAVLCKDADCRAELKIASYTGEHTVMLDLGKAILCPECIQSYEYGSDDFFLVEAADNSPTIL